LVINEGLWVDKELSAIGISDPKTFLIYSPVPWNQGNIERMLSVALQLRGHKVDEVICGGNFPACGVEHCNVLRPPCESCVKNAVSWFDVWNLKFKSTEDFRLQNDLTEAAEIVNRLNVKQYADMNYKRMCELTFESLPIGKRIYEKVYWYFSGDVSNKPKVQEYLEKCAISYVLTARITRRILERTKYDAVIACNGKTIEVGPLMDVVIAFNIRVITWEEMFAFDNNKPVVEYNQDGVWDAVKHKPLTARERTIIKNYFEQWRKSEITPYKYYTDPITDKQQIMNTLGIREESFKIVIFPNLINDSTSIGMHRAFDSMFDWVFSCVEYAIEHPDVDLIIRSHPAEKVKLGYWGSRIYITDAVRNRYRNLSRNVIFVDAESQVSSYTLLELADIAITYTGTLALEAPLYNKLCVVAGKSHLNFKGFTIDLQTKEQMYELFSRWMPIRRATEEEKQLAYQYGFFYRFRVTTKLDFYDRNTTSFNISTIKILKKGGSVFWDNLCESIINNYAFIDLNQPDREVVKLDKSIPGFVSGNDVCPISRQSSFNRYKEKSLETGVPHRIERHAEELSDNRFAGVGTEKTPPKMNLPTSRIKCQVVVADDKLSNIKQLAQKQRFGNWQVKFNGLTIYCEDLLSFYIAAKDIFLHHIYDFESKTDSPVVIDGGGHIGLFTLFVKQKYPNAKITVFEPDKKSLELLRKNLQVNSFNDVKIVEAGLYKNSGEVSFNSDNSDGSSIYSKEKNATINVVRLSEYIDCDTDFLKLNIEGAELDVISEAASKLQRVKEMVIEYHGFPEVGQNLHKLLTILEKAGFRYIIHDFDAETNPATKPPFRLNEQTRFFLLIHAKKLFPPTKSQTAVHDFTDKNTSLQPISRLFGFDRGKPIDRYYIENFLNENKRFIRGRVLEIGGNSYTKKYGSAVTQSDTLNAVTSPNATIVGDLATGENIPESAFDCVIMTQTIQCIYDIKSALKNTINALKPGGTLLITASGISQISRYDMDRWGEYWRFTDKSLRMLLAEFVPEESIHVEAHGNVAVAKAFLDGQAIHELDQEVLDYNDNDYQVLLTARVCKTSPNTTIDLTSGKGTKTTGALKTPLVLLYHRVANDPIDSQLLAVSLENFEAHLKELAENYTVLPLHQLLEEAGKGQLQPDTLAITFDDGYLDNLTNAVPLLEKYGLHATIFVVSGMVDSQSEFWWDALERIFLTGHSLPDLLSIQDSQGILEWGLTTAQDRLKAYDELCGMLRMLPSANIDEIVNQLLTWAGLTRTGRTTHRVVNAQQLKLLASSASFEIGSHSITHTRLSALSPQQQQYEIQESKQQLESIIKKPVRLFSYPYGGLEDITKETGRILAGAGYDAGFANIQGNLTVPVNAYAVPRRLVRNWAGETFARWLKEKDKGKLEAETIANRADRLITQIDQFSLSSLRAT
jgi:FkbM family methyltransferase